MTTKTHPLSGKLHPRTGELLEPLFMWRGQPAYPVMGAAPDDDSNDDDSDSETDDENEDDETGNGDADKGGKDEDKVSRKELDAIVSRMKAADKRASEAEKKLKDIADKEKDELTKATERVEELEKTISTRDGELAELRLQNAFLTAETGITWHDPEAALALAQRHGYLEGVTGDDGKVDGKLLGTKLKELAKAKPYLVNKTGGDSSDEERPPPSGGSVGSSNKGKGKGDKPDISRYAHLTNR